MDRLVALDAVPDQTFLDGLRRAWDGGDAVLPVDPRLPAPARAALLAGMGAGEAVEPGDALVLATSGTTGEAKGAVLTHAALAASAAATSARLGADPGRDRWLACLPLAHAGGLGVVVRALLTGTPLVIRATFAPPAETGATLVSVVGTQLVRHREAVAAHRLALVGGDRPPADRPANVLATYGMTETAGGVAYEGVPLDGVEFRVDDGGQLWVRGPMLLRAFRHGPAPLDADGWYPTGDAGRVDPDGRVQVEGRMGDVVVTGGEKVWPDPVEAVLGRLPGVRGVAVVGRPHPEWGQEVVAVVEVAPGIDPPSLDEARGAVREHLPAWCAPRHVVVTEALPRTASGKIRRHAARSLVLLVLGAGGDARHE